MNWLTTLLIITNLMVFFTSGLIGFNGNITAVQNEIAELEKKIPNLQEQHQWAKAAKACIIDPPEADAGQLLGKWSQMSSRLGVEITEASQNTGKINEVKLAGSGSFNNISLILNNIAIEKAALVKRLSLMQTTEDLWSVEISIAIRSGAWEYFPTRQKNPVPVELENDNAAINSGRPFINQVRRTPTPVSREQIRYIGYFSEQSTPAVIIEVSGKFEVLKCGEKTPGGAVIKSACINELLLANVDASGRETTWTVKMEKK